MCVHRAALFVGLMAAFSAIGDAPPTGGIWLVLLGRALQRAEPAGFQRAVVV